MTYDERALAMHKEKHGKIGTHPKFEITSKDDLSIAYTPGVAAVSKKIYEEPESANELTWKKSVVAVISDGSAVLGLGNIGGLASLPVMEGKAAIMQSFAELDSIPLVLSTQDADEIISTVKAIAPSFGAICLEDITAPKCFVVEEALQDIGIPVIHDDQHGTAIAVFAALLKGLDRVGKGKGAEIVISGAGAAGIAVANLLFDANFTNITLIDSKGVVNASRNDLNTYKQAILERFDTPRTGSVTEALVGADVFIGVSKGDLIKAVDVEKMNSDAIVLAMSNPTPELLPEEAQKASNIALYATGRSDLPNQINNAAVFPGLFKGHLAAGVTKVDRRVFIAVARALAEMESEDLLPSIIDKKTHERVAEVVVEYYS